MPETKAASGAKPSYFFVRLYEIQKREGFDLKIGIRIDYNFSLELKKVSGDEQTVLRH